MHWCNKVIFFYRHQGFGVLSVILANHAIKLLTSLFQDLQVEALHRVNGATNEFKQQTAIISDAVILYFMASGVRLPLSFLL